MMNIRKWAIGVFFRLSLILAAGSPFSLTDCFAMEGETDQPPAAASPSLPIHAETPDANDTKTKRSMVFILGGQGPRVAQAIYLLAVIEHLKQEPIHRLVHCISGVGPGAGAAMLFAMRGSNGKALSAIELLQFYMEFHKTLYRPVKLSEQNPVSAPSTDDFDLEYMKTFYDQLVGEKTFKRDNFFARTMVPNYSSDQKGILYDTHHSSKFDSVSCKQLLLDSSQFHSYKKLTPEDTIIRSGVRSLVGRYVPALADLVTTLVVGEPNIDLCGLQLNEGAVEEYTPNISGKVTLQLILKPDSEGVRQQDYTIVFFGTGCSPHPKDPYAARLASVDNDMASYVTLFSGLSYISLQPTRIYSARETKDDPYKLLEEAFKMLSGNEFKGLCRELGIEQDLQGTELKTIDSRIKEAIKGIDFTNTSVLYFQCILDKFFGSESAEQVSFLKNKRLLPFFVEGDEDRLSFKIGKSVPKDHPGTIILWIKKFILFVREHNDGKSLFSRWKNVVIEGNHDILLKQLVELHAQVQEHYRQVWLPTEDNGIHYLKAMSGINVEDCSKEAAAVILNTLFRESPKELPPQYFFNLFKIDSATNTTTLRCLSSCLPQTKIWLNWMTDNFDQYSKVGTTEQELKIVAEWKRQLENIEPNNWH